MAPIQKVPGSTTYCRVFVCLYSHTHTLPPQQIGKKTSLDCTASATPLSEEIKLELIFEEEWKYAFKLRVTILIYEYLFAMIVS